LILYTGPFPKNFTFPGFKPRYFLKNYKQSDPEKILAFRKNIFDLIESSLSQPNDSASKLTMRNYIDNTDTKYHIYYFNGQKLFAESAYYDTWKPHLDFLNDFD